MEPSRTKHYTTGNASRDSYEIELPYSCDATTEINDPKFGTTTERSKQARKEHPRVNEVPKIDPMLLALNIGRHPALVEMGIFGNILMHTIVDRGSGVNVLLDETWKKLGQPILWPSTFQLLSIIQHGIKPLRTLMVQTVMIGTQPFLLDFVVIPVERKGYYAILGGAGWCRQR